MLFSKKQKQPAPDPNSVELSSEELSKALSLPVQRQDGSSTTLAELTSGRLSILILIRHHHCGMCQGYISSLNANPTLSKLAAPDAPSNGPQLIVLGHGVAEKGIDRYQDMTGNKFLMVSDPSAKVFDALGCIKSLDISGDIPYDTQKSKMSDVLHSVWGMATSGSLMWKGGAFDQLGGDFILSPEGRVLYSHRMKTTVDHTRAEVLLQKAGLSESKPETQPSSDNLLPTPQADTPAVPAI
ncbi:Uncharacterized conserved protein [Ceraceosorus bombacis]|uniref:Uncharacterized conserved protein n=1 Tax=Ceraceosorus bombacis TaxID=401625 RepID=A0A0N7L9G5_9BASI|nr:Uncharacterized conserved protein [Ceraceosorus bombacis]